MMAGHAKHDAAAILRDGDAIDRAIVAAHRRVILRYRQLGQSLAIWRDGRVIDVSPDSLTLPPADEDLPDDKAKAGAR